MEGRVFSFSFSFLLLSRCYCYIECSNTQHSSLSLGFGIFRAANVQCQESEHAWWRELQEKCSSKICLFFHYLWNFAYFTLQLKILWFRLNIHDHRSVCNLDTNILRIIKFRISMFCQGKKRFSFIFYFYGQIFIIIIILKLCIPSFLMALYAASN